MILSRWPARVGSLILLAAAGCGGGTSENAGPATVGTAQPEVVMAASGAPAADDDPAAADLVDHHRHRHGGFMMFVLMSLDSLGANPDQATDFDKIKANLRANMKPELDAQSALLNLLADGIASGSLDTSKVDAAVTQVSSTSQGVAAASAAALNQLHAVLSPPQRQAVADKLEAHWEIWHSANADAEGAAQPKEGGRLAALAKKFGLSSDQVDKVQKALSLGAATAPRFDRSEAEAYVKAFGTAFASATFDSNAIPGAGPANGHLATSGAATMARFYEALAPVLTPDQRSKVSASLRAQASRDESRAGA